VPDSTSFAATDLLSSSPTREATVFRYTYLCRRGARKFARAGLERVDLEQVAAVGLLKAIDRYEAGRGTPFEAFAWLSIIGELLHHVRDHEHLVRLPRRLGNAVPGLRRAADRLMQRLEREATEAELAAELGRSVGEIRDLRRAAATLGPAPDDLHATIGVERPRQSWDERLDLDRALAALPARERHVLVGAYLLGLSNVELGNRLALSVRHIGRLRRSGLERMHGACALGLSA